MVDFPKFHLKLSFPDPSVWLLIEDCCSDFSCSKQTHKVAQSNQVKSSFMNYQNYVIIFLENSTKSEHKAPNFSNGSFGRNFLFISAASPISIHRITFEHGVISNTCFLDGFQGRNFCVCSNKTKVSVSIWWCDQDRTDTA